MITEVPSSSKIQQVCEKNAEVRKGEKTVKKRGKSKNETFQYSTEVGKW